MLAYRNPPRLRTVAIPFLFAFTTLMVFAGQAHAADIDPVGIGDLMPSPDTKVPEGEGTLYETYNNPSLWQLDSDFGKWDILDPMAESIADVCMGLIAVIGTACVVITQWLFQMTSIPPLEDAITKSVGGAAEGLTATLLPSALAVGALVAFVQHKRGGGGGGLSQIAWVLISGVVSVSLLTSPAAWVGGIDTARTVGANITMNATADGLGDGSGDFPFKIDHKPKYTGDGRDDSLRKSSDAVWRAYVATPWCVAQFGSFEVCEKYGKDLLEQGTSKEKRKEWLQENVNEETVGEDSGNWIEGHSPVGRIMITVPSLVAVIMFAALVLILAFTSLASLLGALMLLLTGVIFACLWVIPGRPRQWGLAWFDQLLARTLESLIATMVLGAVLSLQAATTQMFGEYGWLPTVGLSIAAALVGMNFRSVVAQIFGVRGTTTGMLGGVLAARMLGGGNRGGPRRGGGDFDHRPVRTTGGPRPRPGGGGGGGGVPGGGWNPFRRPYPHQNLDSLMVVRPRPQGTQPLPSPPPGSVTGVGSKPPLQPLPATSGAGAGPALPAGTMAGTTPPTGKARATLPPQPSHPRPALPNSSNAAPGATSAGPSATRPAIGPGGTPVMRPENGAPNYAFRQAPPPTVPGEPKIIQATVIRSTPNKPPRPRPSGRTQPPPKPTAPTRRAAASPPGQLPLWKEG
ncbi:hypothetical protein ACTMUQ_42430 [Streptomyces sp. SD11]|uniref:hypothetical protein n=1 Tax=Streptomyces sp. SD11 TaxID=3452209 RepID=UPI003F8A3CC6